MSGINGGRCIPSVKVVTGKLVALMAGADNSRYSNIGQKLACGVKAWVADVGNRPNVVRHPKATFVAPEGLAFAHLSQPPGIDMKAWLRDYTSGLSGLGPRRLKWRVSAE